MLGCVVAASNLYLGLKIGWTFGAALWGSIFGFLALKSLSRVTGSIFGPKENVVCQSAATSAGGLSSGFVTAIPAMYRMGLMGNHKPEDDVTTLLLWTISAAFFGMFFAIPLRAHFVINQNLVFPTPRAAAETIKNLHRASSSAAKDARDSGWAMGISFLVAMIWAIVAFFIPGIFGAIHILYYIGKAAGSEAIMGADARWGWAFTWDFAFFGAGLMTPGSTVFSFLLGELIAFGIAGPIMTTNGYLTGMTGFAVKPSAQSWFLWPGIAMMVVTAFAELGVHYKSLAFGFATAFRELRNVIRKWQKKSAIVVDSEHVSKDPTPAHEMIPTWWWVGGLIVSAIFTVVVMGVNFSVPVYASIGAIILSFLLAFVGLQASGETDINPTGPVAKVAQLVFSRLPGADLQTIQKTNLMCANMTASITSQSVDMVSDLKTAQLVGASPKAMFWAQMVGSVFAVGVAIPLFLLYTKAYPCLLIDPVPGGPKCQFAAPAVTAWANVCKLLTGQGSVAPEALYFSIAAAILALLNVIIRVKFVPDNWKPYWINLNAVGLGFINTSPAVPVAMLVGFVATNVWRRLSAKSHERLMYSISAGLISGVGIAGLVTAAFTIGGVPDKLVLAGCGEGGDLC